VRIIHYDNFMDDFEAHIDGPVDKLQIAQQQYIKDEIFKIRESFKRKLSKEQQCIKIFALGTLQQLYSALAGNRDQGLNHLVSSSGTLFGVVDQLFEARNPDFARRRSDAYEKALHQCQLLVTRIESGLLRGLFPAGLVVPPVFYLLFDNPDLSRVTNLLHIPDVITDLGLVNLIKPEEVLQSCLEQVPFWKSDPTRYFDSTIDAALGQDHQHSAVAAVQKCGTQQEQDMELERNCMHEVTHLLTSPILHRLGLSANPALVEGLSVLFSEDVNSTIFLSKITSPLSTVFDVLAAEKVTNPVLKYYGSALMLAKIGEAIYLHKNGLQAIATEIDRWAVQKEGCLLFMEELYSFLLMNEKRFPNRRRYLALVAFLKEYKLSSGQSVGQYVSSQIRSGNSKSVAA
jgi:hypothetical protein